MNASGSHRSAHESPGFSRGEDVNRSQMVTTTKWLDPKKNPRIVIAPRGELKNQ